MKKIQNKTIFYLTNIKLNPYLVPTIHIDKICTNLVKLGYKTVLYAPKSNLFNQNKPYNIRYIDTPNVLLAIFYQIKLFLYLLIDINREKPRIIYARYDVLLFIPVILGKIYKTPVIYEFNGRQLEELKKETNTPLTKLILFTRILNLIEYLNVRFASGFIVTNNGLKDYIISISKVPVEKVAVIQNGVDIEQFVPGNYLESRKVLNLQNDRFYIGYFGSLFLWQGLNYVIEAIILTCRETSKLKLLIIGDGPEFENIESLIKKNNLSNLVDLRHSVPHENIPAYMTAMDICINYPLKYRGGATSPFKIYEYLSCGKVVVTSDIAEMRKDFGDTLIYVEPESPKVLSSAFLSLINNSPLREQKGIAGRKFIENGHSWYKVTEDILKFCNIFTTN